ncbi:MAG: hypothetical protein J5777_08255 [Clostridiales bacterium]|nr:hypothetical protein [Clostridiales bacterium]
MNNKAISILNAVAASLLAFVGAAILITEGMNSLFGAATNFGIALIFGVLAIVYLVKHLAEKTAKAAKTAA